MADIGKRIKIRREELKMTQEELASMLGYTNKSTIAKIEAGVNDIVQSKVCEFAKALNTTPAYLMGWEESEENKNAPLLTEHETKVITAYRNQPEMQPAVDRLLNISKEDDKKQKYTSHATIAAFGGDGVEVRHLTKEQDEALTAAMKELHNKKRLR